MTDIKDPTLHTPNTLDDGDIEDVASPTRRSAIASFPSAHACSVSWSAWLSRASGCSSRYPCIGIFPFATES